MNVGLQHNMGETAHDSDYTVDELVS